VVIHNIWQHIFVIKYIFLDHHVILLKLGYKLDDGKKRGIAKVWQHDNF
jgi:hypothetical protein